MRVLVCGGRNYADETRLREVLDAIDGRVGITTVIHGAARGADTLAGLWARDNRCGVVAIPALWRTFGLAAGPIRNAEMLRVGQPDLVVAFPGGSGTADMMSQAREAGVQVVEVQE